jgi:hypothetical protein
MPDVSMQSTYRANVSKFPFEIDICARDGIRTPEPFHAVGTWCANFDHV